MEILNSALKTTRIGSIIVKCSNGKKNRLRTWKVRWYFLVEWWKLQETGQNRRNENTVKEEEYL